jgi:hypothetical protein
MTMIKDCIKNLGNPDKQYRGIPFWSWNDKLEEDELRWQVREQEKVGLGGYFMHARAGLKTSYLGREWLDCIEACVEEGSKLGMGSWIYDENGYPSGFAGGVIPAMGMEFQQKFLRFEVVEKRQLQVGENTLGVYRTWGDYGRIESLNEMRDRTELLQVYYEVNPYYSDLLSEKTVKKFIESTYDVYYDKLSKYFGREIPGIFTDEPQYGRKAMPWSFLIPERFRQKYGYDLQEKLPAFYFNTPDYRQVRYDFWNLVTELFTQAFAKQVSEWCDRHNCKLTGHVLLEEDMRYQTLCSGSAMGFYEYMQIPGIDWLGRETGNPVIVKQVASVASQLGKKQVLSEMFACGGWNTSFEDMKHIAEWQYALGVNLMCQHLEGYSIRGLRKRDHPPGMFYQSTWWEDYPGFNDYFARLGMLLTEGENYADLLVVHPLRSGWIAFDQSCSEKKANPELTRLDSQFAELSQLLSKYHYNYHYGDEEILRKHGEVKEGRLHVGKCAYCCILIPPSLSLDCSTVELLKKFILCGGKVLCFEDFPLLCQGRPCDDLQHLRSHCIEIGLENQQLEAGLSSVLERPVRISGCIGEVEAILHQIRCYPDGNGLFFVNMDRERDYKTVVRTEWDKTLYMVHLQDGTLTRIPTQRNGVYCSFELDFAPAQSYMILAADERIEFGELACRACPEGVNIVLDGEWKQKPKDLNALLLDYSRVKLEGGEWSERKPVIKIQGELLELGTNVEIQLEFTFQSDFDFEPDQEMYLVLEDSGIYGIEINGMEMEPDIEGWWLDKAFHKVRLAGTIRKGQNTIILKTLFHNSPETVARLMRARNFEAEANMLVFDSEVESICLLGDFSVRCDGEFTNTGNDARVYRGEFYLSPSREESYRGDLTVNGYPFYAGNVLLEQDFNIENPQSYTSVEFTMEKPHAALYKLYINNCYVRTFLWPSNSCDIKEYMKAGTNRIAIELVATNRNYFGPHHNPEGELFSVGPIHFTDDLGWDDGYCLVRLGLRSDPVIRLNPVMHSDRTI